MAASPRGHRPIRRAARKKTYLEPDSDSEFDLPQTSRSQPRRSARQSAILEMSSADEETDSLSELSDGNDLSFKPGFTASPSSRTTRSAPQLRSRGLAHRDDNRLPFRAEAPPAHDSSPSQRKRSQVFTPSKRRKLNDSGRLAVHPPPAIVYSNSFATSPQTSGETPPWQTLEHQVLVKIMRYAAPMPIEKPDAGAVRWLLNTSELCSSFHEACIAVLLYSPPLLPAHRAHWLVNLLKASARDYGDLDNDDGVSASTSTKKLSLDYRRKVKHLNIEVKQLLIKKQGIDLLELLPLTPLLKTLRLYHNHDIFYSNHLFAQAIFAKDKWSYTDPLFDVLDQHRVRLASFEWNGRFLKDDIELKSLPQYHMRPCLNAITSLAIRNLNVRNVEKDSDLLTPARANLLAALNSLDGLKSLSFDRCNILDSATFGDLPGISLNELSVSACPHITSEGVGAYLTRGGNSLKRLTLTGNQVLSLAFLSNLKELCPKLEEIAIDLTFNDPTSFKDTEPLFDELLPSGAPTWPSGLRSISIGPLRALSADDAEEFYASLIDAADELPYLRTLVIKTILNDISWRDRAKMRSKWLALFDEVFAVDTSALPDPVPATEPNSDPDSKASNKRKSARLRDLEEFQSTPTTPDVGGNNGESSLKRQNRCDVVIFELSDQRPAQDQYNEQDFLDDEPSDDADWNGRDEVLVPTYNARRYAW